MKRFLLTAFGLTLCFLALSIAYDATVLWMMRRSPSCTATKIERAVTGGAGESIAIFGSSRALGNYMPSILAPDAFNYGVNGMSLNETLLLVNHYLRQNTSDSLLLINLDPWGFANPDTHQLIGDYRLAGRKKHFRDAFPGLNLSWPDWTPGLRFQGELRTATTAYINSLRAVTKKIDNGAEILLNSRTEAEWKIIKKGLKPYSFFFDARCEELLKTIYTLQGAHRIVWVVAPTCPAHHANHQNPAAIISFLQKQSANPRVNIINLFNNSDGYPDALFTDPTHLNVHGAEKFTQELKTLLKSLPDS